MYWFNIVFSYPLFPFRGSSHSGMSGEVVIKTGKGARGSTVLIEAVSSKQCKLTARKKAGL